jgi:hypothetical protein
MTAYTPILNIPQVASNQTSKEVTINTGIAILEAAANDFIELDASAGNVVLTTDQYTKYFMLRVQGHTVSRNLDTPALAGTFTGKRFFIVSNEGTASVVVRPSGSSSGTITVAASKIVILQNDGTTLRAVSSGVGDLTDLSDVDVTTVAPTNGQVLQFNSTTGKWDAGDFSSATFTGLTDTPSSYTSKDLWAVRVNAAGTALEFYQIVISDITDFPTFDITVAGNLLRVKEDASGLEWVTPVEASAPALVDLTDVDDSTPPADGQTVIWNAGTSEWVFEDVENGGGPVTITYTFSTTTTDSDPGNGNLRLDSTTQNAAMKIRADLLDVNGASWSSVIDTFDDSTSTLKGYIRLTSRKDSTKFLLFSVSSVDSSSGYRNISVTNIASSATSPFSNGDILNLSFERTGDKGATGDGINWTGNWSSATTYNIGDGVFDTTAGSSFICILGHTNHEPPNATYWNMMAEAGAAGSNGTNGTNGANGGAITIAYTFDNGTSNADPGAGKLRLNNATENAATAIYMDVVDSGSVDWTSVLDTLDASTSTVKGQIRIYKASDTTKWLVFNVTARTTHTSYREFTVTEIGSSASSPFSNGDAIIFAFTRNGDKGITSLAFTGLTDAPSSYSGAGGQVVRVNLATNAVEFKDLFPAFAVSISGKPGASQNINIPILEGIKLPSSLTGSVFIIGTNPTSTMTFTLYQVTSGTATSIGTVAFSTSGSPTVTFSSTITFASGDLLRISAPGSQDATGADISLGFKGSRT